MIEVETIGDLMDILSDLGENAIAIAEGVAQNLGEALGVIEGMQE